LRRRISAHRRLDRPSSDGSTLPLARRSTNGAERRTAAMGWLSLGLGLAQLVAPRPLAKLLGVDADERSELTIRALGATAAVAGMALLGTNRVQRRSLARMGWQGFIARTAITINRSREEVYRYWRDFSNLPHFMQYLGSVHALGNDHQRSHWRAKGPLGRS
jgi:hypothetical protein